MSSVDVSAELPCEVFAFLDILTTDPKKADSDLMEQVISKLTKGETGTKILAERLISLPVLERVNSSPDRVKSWFKFEVFLTKALVAGVVSAEEFESAVLPLLKEPMERGLLSRFGSCLKGTVTSYRKAKPNNREQQFVQLMEWIGWLCSPAADV